MVRIGLGGVLMVLAGCSDCAIPLRTAQHLRWAQACTEMGVVDIQIESGVQVVELPSLQRAQRVEIHGPDLREVSMPSLVEVDEGFRELGAPFLDTLHLPRLERTGGGLEVVSQRLETVDLGALESVGGALAMASGPSTLRLPALLHAQRISMASNTTRDLELPVLQTVDERVDLSGRLVRASMPSLVDDPGVVLRGEFLSELDVSGTSRSPIIEVGRGGLAQNTESLWIETGPGARPTLCVRASAQIHTLSLRGSATFAELSLWQPPYLATVDAPQLTRIQQLEVNGLGAMPPDEGAALMDLADDFGADHCEN